MIGKTNLLINIKDDDLNAQITSLEYPAETMEYNHCFYEKPKYAIEYFAGDVFKCGYASLERAKEIIQTVIDKKKAQELEEIEDTLNSKPKTVNHIRMLRGYPPINPSAEDKDLYERYKAFKPELFKHRCGADVKSLYIDEYGCTGGVHLPPPCKELKEIARDYAIEDIKATLNAIYGTAFTYRKSIWINEKKKVVTAKKPDGSVIKVKCDERDEFDPYVGAALALAYKEFGSKSKFRKYVDELLAKQNKKKKRVRHQ